MSGHRISVEELKGELQKLQNAFLKLYSINKKNSSMLIDTRHKYDELLRRWSKSKRSLTEIFMVDTNSATIIMEQNLLDLIPTNMRPARLVI